MIYYLGAYERFNYGDMLFPKVLNYFLNQKEININNIKFLGLIDANLSQYGGDKIIALSNIIDKLSQDDVIIVVGGEVLNSNSGILYSFIYDSYIINLLVKLKLILPASFVANLKFKLSTYYPYDLYRKETKFFVIYNAVGGLLNKKNISKKTLYFSTRAQIVFDKIRNYSVNLYPDCVAIISDIYSKNNWKLVKSNQNINLINSFKNGYIAFQLNKKNCKKYGKRIVYQLDILSKKTNLPIVFIPIGLAKGHEDMYSYEFLKLRMKSSLKLINPSSIYDILYSISNCSMFIGTSLHGNITAMSYNIPNMGFGGSKVHNYLNKWAGGIQKNGSPSIDKLCTTAIAILEQPKSRYTKENQNHKLLAYENLNKISKIVKEFNV